MVQPNSINSFNTSLIQSCGLRSEALAQNILCMVTQVVFLSENNMSKFDIPELSGSNLKTAEPHGKYTFETIYQFLAF